MSADTETSQKTSVLVEKDEVYNIFLDLKSDLQILVKDKVINKDQLIFTEELVNKYLRKLGEL